MPSEERPRYDVRPTLEDAVDSNMGTRVVVSLAVRHPRGGTQVGVTLAPHGVPVIPPVPSG